MIKVHQNEEFGFFQVDPLPSVQELDNFYNSNYYDVKGYSVNYSENEIFQKQLAAIELSYFMQGKRGKILDIGCGEGFVLNYLHEKGWNVTGLDFSHDGVKRHFPHLIDNVIKGDVFKTLEDIMASGEKYDAIVCNNVLEHVLHPLDFLKKFKALCHKDTIVRIQVPNDFSWFQDALKKEGLINNEYWVAPPGHLSYFNQESLSRVLNGFGYQIDNMLGDFPIEMFLLNSQSNYNKKPSVGPDAHKARVTFDINLYKSSLSNFISFRKGCGESGVCRNLIAYCTLTK